MILQYPNRCLLSIANTVDPKPYVEIGTSNRYLHWEIAAEASTVSI